MSSGTILPPAATPLVLVKELRLVSVTVMVREDSSFSLTMKVAGPVMLGGLLADGREERGRGRERKERGKGRERKREREGGREGGRGREGEEEEMEY